MGIKDQFNKLKENWLIAALVIVLFLFMSGGNNILDQSVRSMTGGYANYAMAESYDGGMAKSAYYGGSYQDDFAPEVEERLKVVTSNLRTEVERTTFNENTVKLKNIIKASDGYILNENINKYGESWRESYSGSWTIKIDTKKYDAVVSQLKEIGEIQSFSESETDVTGQYTDLEADLVAEIAKLARYQETLDNAERTEDKMNLIDRIFNQERRISYLEERIENIDKRVDYSTVYFSMNEKQSDWASMSFVKFSELIKNFVQSSADLLRLLFTLVPWAIAGGLGWAIYRFFKRK